MPGPARRHRSAAATIATVMLTLLAATAASAQAYPTGPVKVVVPFGAGGATDVLARVFADQLQQRLGQPFTPENRGGAAGQIAATAVARSPADGSTLMFTTAAPITIAPLMNDKVQYDPRKDFVPIAVVAVMPVWLVVNANSPLKSAADIVAQSQGQSRQAQLRDLRRRHRAASGGRGVVPLGRHPDAARAVSRRRRGDRRAARQPARLCGAEHRLDCRGVEAGQPAGARGLVAAADGGLPRCADLRRDRPSRRHHDAVVGLDGAGRHAAARSSRG